MELLLQATFFIALVYLAYRFFNYSRLNLPPSPRSLPLVGHLHLLKGLPHDAFSRLSKEYGDIILLQLGKVPAIVISSPELAKVVLRDLDRTFASRPWTVYGQYVCCGQDMAMEPYTDHWKNMRKLCTTELFTVRRIDSFIKVRLEELTHMLNSMVMTYKAHKPVNLRSALTTMNFNTTTRILISKRFFDYEHGERDASVDVEAANEFRELCNSVVEECLKFHIADFMPPYLKWIDWTIPRARKIRDKQHKFMQKYVDEHRAQLDTGKLEDFMDTMLRYTEHIPEGDAIVKMMVAELITAGSDTSSTVIEWALAELFLSPKVLEKCKEELDKVVGCSRMVLESDIKDLEYLQAVVKETFRLHPPAGTLVPHMSTQDCKVAGYDVPKGTTMFVNVHAIGRDPRVWEQANEFMPERFLGTSVDVKGQDFELLPFGAGRRSCPGMMLGLKTVHLVLSNLVHGFDLSAAPGKEGTYNLEEYSGGVTWMKTPLELVCAPRFPEDN